MEIGSYFSFNGQLVQSGKLVISADNRSFRFGEGFFETMRMVNGNIPLSKYHFERLFCSLPLLKFETPHYLTAEYFSDQINRIVEENNHAQSARIRLTIFSGDGGLYDIENRLPNYFIQTWNLKTENSELNKHGLVTRLYVKARKSSDDFSHIKSNNFLPYAMAAMWAKENNLDDAFILNNYEGIADASAANIFIIKDGKIKTPALSEGCINGVMRKYLIQCLQKENIPLEETRIHKDELFEANEIFLTNAVQGLKWVRKFENYNYDCKLSEYLYNQFIIPLFKPSVH